MDIELLRFVSLFVETRRSTVKSVDPCHSERTNLSPTCHQSIVAKWKQIIHPQ
ncbi:hypothetical protein LINPERPRIM_LOCUS341 [Linum perenne]